VKITVSHKNIPFHKKLNESRFNNVPIRQNCLEPSKFDTRQAIEMDEITLKLIPDLFQKDFVKTKSGTENLD
jgi:hypothetical protein